MPLNFIHPKCCQIACEILNSSAPSCIHSIQKPAHLLLLESHSASWDTKCSEMLCSKKNLFCLFVPLFKFSKMLYLNLSFSVLPKNTQKNKTLKHKYLQWKIIVGDFIFLFHNCPPSIFPYFYNQINHCFKTETSDTRLFLPSTCCS